MCKFNELDYINRRYRLTGHTFCYNLPGAIPCSDKPVSQKNYGISLITIRYASRYSIHYEQGANIYQ